MNIEYLKDFLCLSKTMNLTSAAEIRGTTQSNFSKRLKSLEEWLGHELIDRNIRPISLTSYGEAFSIRAKSILEDLHEFKENRIPWDTAAGGIRVATSHTATYHALPNLMCKLRSIFPSVFLLPRVQNQTERGALLSRSECELAVAARHKELTLSAELEVFRSAEFDADRLTMVYDPSQLQLNQQASLFAPHEGTYLGRIWREYRPESIRYPEIGIGLAAEIRAHCLSGNGIGVLPHSLVEADLLLNRLTPIELSVDLAYTYCLFCAPRASPLARQVWEAVRKME